MLQIDAHDFYAHLVAVQNRLHQRAHLGRNLIALFGQRRVHPHLADHFANRRFGRLHDSIGRVLAFKQKGARVAQAVLDGELDLNDVLVFGEHRRFAQAGGLYHVVATDVDRSDLGHKDHFMALNRVRQPPVEARQRGAAVLAELGDDRLLPLLDDEEAGSEPDQHHDTGNQARTQACVLHVGLKAAATATPGLAVAAKQAAQPAVEFAPQLLKVGWPLVRSASASVVSRRWRRGWGHRWRLALRRRRLRLAALARLVVTTSPARVVEVEHRPQTREEPVPSRDGRLNFHLIGSHMTYGDCAQS